MVSGRTASGGSVPGRREPAPSRRSQFNFGKIETIYTETDHKTGQPGAPAIRAGPLGPDHQQDLLDQGRSDVGALVVPAWSTPIRLRGQAGSPGAGLAVPGEGAEEATPQTGLRAPATGRRSAVDPVPGPGDNEQDQVMDAHRALPGAEISTPPSPGPDRRRSRRSRRTRTARTFLFGLLCARGRARARRAPARGPLERRSAWSRPAWHGVQAPAALGGDQRRDAYRRPGPSRPASPERPRRRPRSVAEAFELLLATGDRRQRDRRAVRRGRRAGRGDPLGQGRTATRSRRCATRDDLLATVLEVYAGGRYLWVPLSRTSASSRSPSRKPTLTDLLWCAGPAPRRRDGHDASVYRAGAPIEASFEAERRQRAPRARHPLDRGPRPLRQPGERGQRVLLALRQGDAENELPLLSSCRNLEIEGWVDGAWGPREDRSGRRSSTASPATHAEAGCPGPQLQVGVRELKKSRSRATSSGC